MPRGAALSVACLIDIVYGSGMFHRLRRLPQPENSTAPSAVVPIHVKDASWGIVSMVVDSVLDP